MDIAHHHARPYQARCHAYISPAASDVSRLIQLDRMWKTQ